MQLGRLFSSHKFAGKSGLRYEVGICILTGDIVWINGPYECGIWPDISIFRDALVSSLAPNERIEADDGYLGEHPEHVKCPKGFANDEITEFMQQRARNRQETMNKRFKLWGILKQVFRHKQKLVEHGDIFRAVAVICQLAVNNGEVLFSVGYRDPPYHNNNGSSADGFWDDDL